MFKQHEICSTVCLSFISATSTIVQNHFIDNCAGRQRYTYRVLQTIQMKLILLLVWAERAVLGRAKSASKFKYEIQIG